MTISSSFSRMNLDHLKTFHFVALLGSFTKAAQALYLTQPAVSLQIQGIENALKVQLFDRSRKHIILTPKGKVLYTYTRRLFGLFDEIEHVFEDINHLQTGSLTIAASAVMGNYYLPKAISIFSKRYPLIKIRIRMADSKGVAQMVLQQEADIGLSRRVPQKTALHQTFLHQEEYVCVAPKSSPWLRLGRSLTIEEFGEALIVMREPGTRMRMKIEEWFIDQEAKRFLPKPQVEVNSLEASKGLVVQGFGVGAFPSIVVKEEIASGQLILLNVNGFRVNADYYLSTREDNDLSPAALQFVILLKELSNNPDDPRG